MAEPDSISVVVPTFREVLSLPHLISALEPLAARADWALEVLIVDDDSQDGTVELLAQLQRPWLRLLVRKGRRDLSLSVLEGLRAARGQFLVVMDADLSHPPASISTLLGQLKAGADFAIGSRYVPGGTTSDDWGVLRWLNSRLATLMAWPLVWVRDPMSGFFALRRETFGAARDLDPIGYKIGLELLVKCRCLAIAEIPIHFENRRYGHSKLTLTQQLRFLRHIRRLWTYKHAGVASLLQFFVVGALGTVVNLAPLTALLATGAQPTYAVAIAILVSMLGNFALNRRFSFSYARDGSIARQLAGFLSVSLLAAAINYAVTLSVMRAWPSLRTQWASLVGIVAGTGLNFVLSRYAVFRRRFIRPGSP